MPFAAAVPGTAVVSHADPLVGRTFRQRLGGPDPEFIRVADAFEYDGEPALRLWHYSTAKGFLAVTEEDRRWFETLRDQGHWQPVEELPQAILKQVSGDEVPGAE